MRSLTESVITDGVDVAVRLVGEVRVIHRGNAVYPRVVGGQRCAEVFAFLPVHRHRDVRLEELAAVVWPAERPKSWNAAIRGVLSRARDSLEIAGLAPEGLRSRGGLVRLTLPPGTVTDLEFASTHQAADPDPVETVRQARTVLGLLDGLVLPDVTGQWADETRSTVARLLLRALEVDAEMSSRIADHEHAVIAAERLISVDPLRESAYRIAMRGKRGRRHRRDGIRRRRWCRRQPRRRTRHGHSPVPVRRLEHTADPLQGRHTSTATSPAPGTTLPPSPPLSERRIRRPPRTVADRSLSPRRAVGQSSAVRLRSR
jgi:DNA-binding SARP family transcriptional activator